MNDTILPDPESSHPPPATPHAPAFPARRPQPPSLRAYLQLVRLPAVFTALADVLMGYFFIMRLGETPHQNTLVALAISSAFLYLAGMALNDVFDVEQDTAERPFRPIPSGRVPLAQAKRIGWGLLACGVVAGWAAAYLAQNYLPGVIATALATAVVLYDGVLKRTFAAPLLMGACRFLNVMLGMSPHNGPWETAQFVAAAGLGIYIVGVTIFARKEAGESRRSMLLAGLVVILLGIGTIASLPQFPLGVSPLGEAPANWYLLLALITGLLLFRCGAAVRYPDSDYVQAAVRHCLLAIIVLDATVTLLVQHSLLAVCVLIMMPPSVALGRWLYST